MSRFQLSATGLLMRSSVAFLGAIGLVASFFPQEIVSVDGSPSNDLLDLIVQAGGAAYLGFGILNWMSRDNVIGGIYSRPLALGNFLHFFAAGMAMLKVVIGGFGSAVVLVVGVLYAVFAVGFGILLIKHPRRQEGSTA